MIESIFNKSKKQCGYIYLCKKECRSFKIDELPIDATYEQNGKKFIKKENFNLGEVNTQWKYGKTKDIKKRMKMYSSLYTLLNSYNVNHLSFRENLIRADWSIEEDRRCEDARTEHVSFDISDIVELYANCDIVLSGDEIKLYEKGEKECFQSMSANSLLDSLSF